MNLGDIKSIDAGKQSVESSSTEQKKAQEQARFQKVEQTSAFHVSLSSQDARLVASAKVLQASFEQNVTVNNQQLLASLTRQPEKKESMFDFEEVAKNVLNFVGGAIKAAAKSGADDEELLKMFEEAEKGVLKGIEMARKDLAGFMNEEIDEGINKSQELITSGMEDLYKEIFGTEDEESLTEVNASQEVNYSSSQSGSIQIQTADGDEVTISFESIQEFQANQSINLVSTTNTPSDTEQDQQQSSEEIDAAAEDKAEQPSVETQLTANQSYQFYDSEQIAFSVKGELDEAELDAIAAIVEDASGLINDFFEGDVQAAFEQALSFGFDEDEIANLAIELTQTESVEVVQQYERVSNYSEEQEEQRPPIKTVADYVDNLLQLTESAAEEFGTKENFDNLVNGLINQVVEIKTDDLLDAINRFNTFNNRFGVENYFTPKGNEEN